MNVRTMAAARRPERARPARRSARRSAARPEGAGRDRPGPADARARRPDLRRATHLRPAPAGAPALGRGRAGRHRRPRCAVAHRRRGHRENGRSGSAGISRWSMSRCCVRRASPRGRAAASAPISRRASSTITGSRNTGTSRSSAGCWSTPRWTRTRKLFDVGFDPQDVPRDQFLVAGDAWRLCRDGKADPDDFCILDMKGWWFIASNVIRDVAALNGHEMLPWDVWGAMVPDDDKIDRAFIDRLAGLSSRPDADPEALRAAYDDSRVAVPAGRFQQCPGPGRAGSAERLNRSIPAAQGAPDCCKLGGHPDWEKPYACTLARPLQHLLHRPRGHRALLRALCRPDQRRPSALPLPRRLDVRRREGRSCISSPRAAAPTRAAAPSTISPSTAPTSAAPSTRSSRTMWPSRSRRCRRARCSRSSCTIPTA